MTTETLSPMQQELLNRADAIFAAISSTVSEASDAAMAAGSAVAAEIPDIAFQYIAFGRVYMTIIILIAFVFMFMGVYGYVGVGIRDKMKLGENRYSTEWAAQRIIISIIGIFSAGIGFIIFLVNIKETVLVWAAPKVWLLLEMVELIRRVRG